MNHRQEKWGRIGILMGGYSTEREISLKSGKAIEEALKSQGCEVVALDIQEKEENKITQFIRNAGIDMAFIALHGRLGEDGTIQSLLEQMNIPYTGSGVEASRKAINKVTSQAIFKKNGILIAPSVGLSKNNGKELDSLIKNIDFFPVVVKPAWEGSSIGIRLLHDSQDLPRAVFETWKFGDQILVEKYIEGKELTVGILDSTPLPIVEIRPQETFFDFGAKYQSGTTQYVVPAPLSPSVTQAIQSTALKAHTLIGCKDLSRVDMILAADGNFYVLEINTIPGFTSTSLLPKAAKSVGISFDQLCLKLLDLANGQTKKIKPIASRR